jgi:hypothetical protein
MNVCKHRWVGVGCKDCVIDSLEAKVKELKKDVKYWKTMHINGNEFIKKLEAKAEQEEKMVAEKQIIIDDLCDKWEELQSKNARLRDAGEMLWVVLANVSGGDWKKQNKEWQEAAAKWRDNYFQQLSNQGDGVGD